jgi:hypothetical protein
VPKPVELATRGGCWFEAGDLRVHLGVEEPFTPARKAHAGFEVEGLAGLVERLAAAGCDVRDEPYEGFARVYTDDPFGNRLELLEPLGQK